MSKEELYQYIDHTCLNAFATWDDIQNLCREAETFHMASVCIPSSYVKPVREVYPDLTICTVIGFPLGNMNTRSKLAEAAQALEDGADEFDMVINIGWAKDGFYEKCEDEIRQMKELVGDKILKVIIETCYLNRTEKIHMCRAVTEAGADYIKTSTGFGSAGATLEDVRLMKQYIGPDVKIKAAGGIRTREELETYLKAGCSRIGTSRVISMLE